MNSDEIKYSTCKAVSLYRKFVSWWTVLDATSDVLASNFQPIVHYLEVNCKSRQNFRNLKKCVTFPMNAFINSTAMVKENLTSLTQEVLNLIELSSSNTPYSEEDLLDVYDIIYELQEDLKEHFTDYFRHEIRNFNKCVKLYLLAIFSTDYVWVTFRNKVIEDLSIYSRIQHYTDFTREELTAITSLWFRGVIQNVQQANKVLWVEPSYHPRKYEEEGLTRQKPEVKQQKRKGLEKFAAKDSGGVAKPESVSVASLSRTSLNCMILFFKN
ncbi:hypothetical protein CDAR_409921 [Caerostris darwini]|uniref:Uncharacterized protein n=1 Tax=Caerostris darwini TaxID=1538125 RepID=A0AAV4VXN8_9ARAC|nr:hypothetical protein CDAR_409921 [Caerostris darwini]